MLAISSNGRIVRDTGRIDGLNPGGGNFGPDGRYFVGLRSERTIVALSTSFDAALEHVYRPGSYLSPQDLLLVKMVGCSSPQEYGPNGQGDNTILAFTPGTLSSPLGWSQIPN